MDTQKYISQFEEQFGKFSNHVGIKPWLTATLEEAYREGVDSKPNCAFCRGENHSAMPL